MTEINKKKKEENIDLNIINYTNPKRIKEEEEEEIEEETIEDDEEDENFSIEEEESEEKKKDDKSLFPIIDTSKTLSKINNENQKIKPIDKVHIYKKIKEKEDSFDEKNKFTDNDNNDLNKSEKKNINEKNLDVKSICITIFLYYSSFNFEEKDFVITQLNLNKMLKDLKMLIPEKNLSNSSSKNNTLNKSKSITLTNQNNLKGIHIYEIDLLIKKVRNKGKYLTSSQYLNFLVQISDRIYHKIFITNPLTAFEKLVKEYILDYYNYLNNPSNSKLLNPLSIFQINKNLEKQIKIHSFNLNIIFIFNDIYNTLKIVYKTYFRNEVNGNTNLDLIIKHSLGDLIKLCKDFNISPYYVEMNKVIILYHLLLEMTPNEITKIEENEGEFLTYNNNMNMGKVFTLSKFCMFLFHCSIIVFNKLKYVCPKEQFDKVSTEEKLLLFLDKVNEEKGLLKLQKNNLSFTNKNLTLLPNNSIINNIDMVILKKDISEKNIDLIPIQKSTNIIEEEQSDKSQFLDEIESKFNSFNLGDYKQYLTFTSNDLLGFYESNLNYLQKLFEEFCYFGEKSEINNLNKMNLTGYIYFLSSINIIKNNNNKNTQIISNRKKYKYNISLSKRANPKCLSERYYSKDKNKNFNENDANVIFNSVILQNTNEKKKVLSFPLFIKSFELITKKLFGNVNDILLLKFLNQNILPLIIKSKDNLNKKEEIVKILSEVRKSNIMIIINDIEKIIYGIYLNYCDQNEFLHYDKFFQCYKDLTLFPNILNINQLKIIFFTVCDLFKEQVIIELNKQNNKLDRDNLVKYNPFFKDNLINFEIFCETLGISSYFIKGYEKSNQKDIHQVLELLRRMSQQNSVENILKNSQFNINYNSAKDFNAAFKFLKERYLNNEDDDNYKRNKGSDNINYKKILNSPTSFEDIFPE